METITIPKPKREMYDKVFYWEPSTCRYRTGVIKEINYSINGGYHWYDVHDLEYDIVHFEATEHELDTFQKAKEEGE